MDITVRAFYRPRERGLRTEQLTERDRADRLAMAIAFCFFFFFDGGLVAGVCHLRERYSRRLTLPAGVR